MSRVTSLLAIIALAATALACQGNVFQLKLGDCFTGGDSANVSNVNVVECTQAHDAEVYYIFNYPDAPSSYPGDDAVQTTAADGCKPAFSDFVGLAFDSSSYGLKYLRPTSDSWGQGDRTIDCLITSGDGTTQLTGSAKGTAR
jgi:Septum formation